MALCATEKVQALLRLKCSFMYEQLRPCASMTCGAACWTDQRGQLAGSDVR